MGNNVYASFNLTVVDDGEVFIGDKVMFGPNVTIATVNHPIEKINNKKIFKGEYKMDNKWKELYDAAKSVLKPRDVSGFIEAGGVSAAIESVTGKIYVGVCVDTACTLGICAERNAIFNMITNGEDAIKRVIAINRDGKAMPPCGACREFMTQLMPEEYSDIEIMMDYENDKVVTLGEITPEWWI